MNHQFFPRVISPARATAIIFQSTAARRTLACAPRLPPLQTASLAQSARQNPDSRERSYSRPPVPPPSNTPETLASLSYIVRRTPSVQLPVYRRQSSGGTRKIVLIKKVEGDRRKMATDIGESLGLKKENIRINPTTQHIELKGDYYHKAKDWLLERGF